MRTSEIRKLLQGPEGSAEAVGLVYLDDRGPGISRRKSGKRLIYRDEHGKPVDAGTRKRIDSLAIPPAYRDVWISPDPCGHLQATGFDEKSRKQYRYHPEFLTARGANKFAKMLLFGKALPKIRAQVGEDLKLPGLPRERVLALVVSLLEKTMIRVGNVQYERDNESKGLTTMGNENVEVTGTEVRFHFRGKSGKEHEIATKDRRIAGVLKKMEDLPGQHLFRYKGDDGELHDVTSADVNAYIKEIAGEEFTAKDFRTWNGTLLAAQSLRDLDPPVSKRAVSDAVKRVAGRLGNTPAVCRASYIHPAIIESAAIGELGQHFARKHADAPLDPDMDESALLRMLGRKLDEATVG